MASRVSVLPLGLPGHPLVGVGVRGGQDPAAGREEWLGRGQGSREAGPALTSQGLSQLHALPPRLWGVSGLGDPFWGPPL